MAADAGIFEQYLKPVRSVADYSNDMDKQEQNALTLAASRLTNQKTQQEMADDQASRQASIASGGDSNKLVQALFAAGNHKAAQAVQKQMLDAQKTQADIGHLKSQSSKLDAETLETALASTRSFANQVDSPQAAAMYLKGIYSHPLLGPVAASMMPIDQAMASIPQDMNSPEGLRWKAAHANISGKELLGILMPKTDSTNLGGNQSFGKTDQFSGVRTQTGAAPITQSADNAATVGATMRGQNMTDRRARDLNLITKEGQQTQVINDPVRGPLLVNKATGLVRSAVGLNGQPLQGEIPAKKEAAAKSMLPILDEADKLIDGATGSYIGAAVDQGARAFGAATTGAKNTAQLKVLEGNLMLSQPRMEGPQSDKDVMLYRQMAGQIGDPTVPKDIKKSALATIRQLTEKYAGTIPAANGLPNDIADLLKKHGGK